MVAGDLFEIILAHIFDHLLLLWLHGAEGGNMETAIDAVQLVTSQDLVHSKIGCGHYLLMAAAADTDDSLVFHLNPLRANLVKGSKELDRYKYSGHAIILGRRKNLWQDTDYVLKRFGVTRSAARREYRKFVKKGVDRGKMPELTGGGLVRSVGGWSALKVMRRMKAYVKGDERILGDSDFVLQSLKESDEQLERQYKIRTQGYDLNKIAGRVADVLGIEIRRVFAAGKNRQTVRARSLLCYWAVRDVGMTMTFLSKKLGLSLSAVSQSVQRGEQIATENKFRLMP